MKFSSGDFIQLCKENGLYAFGDIKELLKGADSSGIANTIRESKEIPKSHTTILSALYKGGAFLACDRRVSMGSMISGDQFNKIALLDKHTAMGFSGVVFIADSMAHFLTDTFYNMFKRNDGVPIPLDAKIQIVTGFIQSLFPLLSAGLVVAPIVTSYDAKKKMCRILNIDPVGYITDATADGFASAGSGGFGLGAAPRQLVDAGWNPAESSREESLKKLAYLFCAAFDVDSGSGATFYRGIYPLFYDVSEDGIKEVSKNEITEVFNNLNLKQGS